MEEACRVPEIHTEDDRRVLMHWYCLSRPNVSPTLVFGAAYSEQHAGTTFFALLYPSGNQ